MARNQAALSSWLIPPLCALCLIWPALWNGYPIVFADTGTYLSQVVHRYLGWDRPVFYSLFMWPLHLGLTTWPVIVVQAGLTVLVLDLTRRALDVSRWWLLALTVFLAVATWLPWTVSELMPDLFTPLLILLLSLLVFCGPRFKVWQRAALTALAAFMIATQQSSVPLALGLLAMTIPFRWIASHSWAHRQSAGREIRPQEARPPGARPPGVRPPPARPPGVRTSGVRPLGIRPTGVRPPEVRPLEVRHGPDPLPVLLAPLLAPAVAIVALVLVNTIGFGRISLSPYGNVFVLARVIYDGPGMTVLRRDCPDRGWRLCPYLDSFPASSDEFLWAATSPVMLAGGHKAISADADAIIRTAMAAEPGRLIAATWDNTIEQLTRFASGDGLESWNGLVGSWIDRDFPARERTAFHAARQQLGTLAVPPPLAATHRAVVLAGIAAAVLLLPVACRRRHVAAWFLAVTLLALPLSAAITGGLSTPHDRYQSRIVWLPTCIAFLSAPALLRRRRD